MEPGELLVVVATYNERENMPGLLQRIWEAVPQAQVLVVDDHSPDGTGRWCTELSQTEPRLTVLIRRGERGLGSATIAGLQTALTDGYRFVGTLDADGSHDPAVLPHMLARLDAADERVAVVIGSRYAPGGRIVGWPWYRRWTSRLVNGLVRLSLRLGTLDNSGAFRLYRTAWLGRLGLQRIRSEGYAYLEELLFRLHQAGAEATELPITFRDRSRGRSKATWRELIGVLTRILRLRLGG